MESMRILETTPEINWIPAFAGPDIPRADGSCVVRVGDLLPACFEEQAKLFHPIHEDLGCADPGLLWESPWDERYGRGRAERPFAARGIKWHDLAEELDLDYDAGFHLADFLPGLPHGRWPRRLVGPEDGELDVDTVHHLMRILQPFTADQPCLHYWPAPRSRTGEPLLLQAPLSELLSLHADVRTVGPPTGLWPRDRSWLFLCHPELPFSLLAGPRDLIAMLLRDKPLDGVEVPLSMALQHR